jgi:hypothetical protein
MVRRGFATRKGWTVGPGIRLQLPTQAFTAAIEQLSTTGRLSLPANPKR